MNVERFHAVVEAILQDVERYNYRGKLKELIAHLQNRISDPSNPNHQANIDQALLKLRELLLNLESNTFPAAWRSDLQEYGLSIFNGEELLKDIEDTLQANSLTPSVAHSELKKILEQVTADLEALRKLKEAFARFEIPLDEPPAGSPEMGVLVPRLAVDDGLREFGNEITKLAKIVGVFQELGTGSRADPKITSLSSSDFSIFFLIDLQTALLISDAIKQLVAGFESLVKLKKMIEELRANNVPSENLSGLEAHANNIIEAKIEEITTEVTTTKSGKKTERHSELRIELKGALSAMAKRMDAGFVFEVRAKPADGKADIGETSPEELAHMQNGIAHIQANHKATPLLKRGDRPILSIGVDSELALPKDEASRKAKGGKTPK